MANVPVDLQFSNVLDLEIEFGYSSRRTRPTDTGNLGWIAKHDQPSGTADLLCEEVSKVLPTSTESSNGNQGHIGLQLGLCSLFAEINLDRVNVLNMEE